MIALVVTLCFLNFDGTPTEDCRHLWKAERTAEDCETDRLALPPILSDAEGRGFVEAECRIVARGGTKT